MENITRRNFIDAAASTAGIAATVALTAAPMAMGDEAAEEEVPAWLGTEPQYDEAAIVETIEADVVVVGAGVSGVAATRAAVEAGASVILLEKGETVSGRGEDYTVLGGKIQERYGRADIDRDQIIDELMKECTFRTKRSILKKWADNCGEAFDWLLECKPDIFIADYTRQDIPDEHADFFGSTQKPVDRG